MKIRTDFVTNSSSSCFCAITVTLKDKTELHWEDSSFQDNLTFDLLELNPEKLKSIQSTSDLLSFLKRYACSERRATGACNILAQVEDLNCLEYLEISCNEFLSDQGFSPEEGAEGIQLTYNFSNGEYIITREPDPKFITDMNSMFCWE